jgi:Kef-type K+ transport system membrane component KefB
VNTVAAGPTASAALPGWRAAVAYLLMLVACIGLFFLVRWIGEGLTAPEVPPGAAPVARTGAGQVNVTFHVLATLAAVVALGHALGHLFVRIGQPPVIGEVVAGILLGPSLLGAISPDAMHWLIQGREEDPNGQVIAAVRAIAQVGVVLYMFLVGLELNAAKLKTQAHTTVAVAHTSIVVPFVLGSCLALWLYPLLSHRGVPFASFALFMGVALSVTAFPVMARILSDRRMDKTTLGVTALGCAAADDVTAWCLLALVVGVAQAQVGNAVLIGCGALAFIAVMFVVVRPVLARVVRRLDDGLLPRAAVPAVFVGVLLAALATEAIGIHAVFGAFLLGAVIPHDSRLARELTAKLHDLVTTLLLPAFFAVTGLRMEIGLVTGWQNWLICGVIIVVATAGKLGGTLFAARLTGRDWRTSAALGALMNTRGLMGLIVLDIGLDLGVISPTLFAMMVLMAIVTTMTTAPLLHWLVPATVANDPRPA